MQTLTVGASRRSGLLFPRLPSAPSRLMSRLITRAEIAGVTGAGFVPDDVDDWLGRESPAAFLDANGTWVNPPQIIKAPGPPLSCHLTAGIRMLQTAGEAPERRSMAWFGVSLFQPDGVYSDRPMWWVHGWAVEADGTLVCSAQASEPALYFGVPWSRALLDAVRPNHDHPFTTLLELVVGDRWAIKRECRN